MLSNLRVHKVANQLLVEGLIFFNLVSDLGIHLQVVYNANKLSELVKEKKKVQNWLDYYKIKYSRNQSKRPSSKVLLCSSFWFFLYISDISWNVFPPHKLNEQSLSLYFSHLVIDVFVRRLVFWVCVEKRWTQLISIHLKLKNFQKR